MRISIIQGALIPIYSPFALLFDLMEEVTLENPWWCFCCTDPGSSSGWPDGKTEL